MKVVNKHTHVATNRDVYIGRGSVYGNPFVIGKDGSREEVIEKYRQYLWKNLQTNAGWCDYVLALGQYDNLVCFCSPKPCHGDVLIRAYAWLSTR